MFLQSSKQKQEKGQGLVEYALILVLVAIVVIAALMVLGPIIGNVFSTINNSLSTVSTGGDVPDAPAAPDCSAEQAVLDQAIFAQAANPSDVNQAAMTNALNSHSNCLATNP